MSAPTVLLLHGFPSSSHMFRDLIPDLAAQYHVIAPDYPGFGQSSAPSVDGFTYTFANLAAFDAGRQIDGGGIAQFGQAGRLRMHRRQRETRERQQAGGNDAPCAQ